MTQSTNRRGITNNANAKQDGRQKKFSKQQFNTRMDKIMENLLFISLVKCTLQSLEGQRKKQQERKGIHGIKGKKAPKKLDIIRL